MVASRAIAKKFVELGRIRIGMREPNASGKGTHPKKLGHFRLTSPNGSLLTFAAQLYGGTVEPWDDEWAPKDEYHRPTQFELYTTTNELAILIPTFSAITLSFERWSASGCQQRCTGEVVTHCPLQEALIGQACTCPVDDQERADLATSGKACARILRLNVLLPDLPGAGVFRLETKGFYATAELMGTLDMLQMAGHEHQIIEATLRLEQRQVKRVGKGEGKGTLQFAVPVLVPTYTPRQLLSGAAAVLLAPATTPPPPPALTEAIEALYGPTITPAGEDGAHYIAQIEAAILGQGGKLDTWYAWAEKHRGKSRERFSVEDWQWFLESVRAAAQYRERQETPAQTASQEPQEGTQGQEGGQDVSASEPQEARQPGEEELDLWQQEERAEGNGE